VTPLFKFATQQEIFEIEKVKIGGQPGQLPTVLVGNIFYKGMPEVKNHVKGEFEKEKACKWIKIAEELSERTGVPHLLDVMAMYPEAIEKYILFVSEKSSKPFLIDGANPETRLTALRIIKELGLQNRAIFNAISPHTSKEELEVLRNSDIKVAVLLTHNEMDFSPKGRISILEGSESSKSLLEMAKEGGIEKILIDTIVYDLPSIAQASEAIKLVKEKFGYPAGCSPANATYDWKASADEFLKKAFSAINASAHAIPQFCGANFLIYGPIKQAEKLIPSVAVVDAIIAYYAMKIHGIKPLVATHPIHKIF
jgi:tetrahydromethanopterin S-methyltransferase subunit H